MTSSTDPGPVPLGRPLLGAFHAYDSADLAYTQALYNGRSNQVEYEMLMTVRDQMREDLMRLIFRCDELLVTNDERIADGYS